MVKVIHLIRLLKMLTCIPKLSNWIFKNCFDVSLISSLQYRVGAAAAYLGTAAAYLAHSENEDKLS